MNSRSMWALAMKDMRSVGANLQVWLPMLLVPLLLGVILPGGVVFAMARVGPDQINGAQEIISLIEKLPAGAVKSRLDGLPGTIHQSIYLVTNYLFASFFLLIPLMTASVIAADSFAGEKERGTLESLLFTPVDILSLFGGKVLAAFVPAVSISLLTFLLNGLVVNLVGWPLFGYAFFPHVNWLPLMLLVIPMISLSAILLNVFISARVSSFQAAYQMGGMVVLPVMVLVFGQISGAMLLEAGLLTGIGLSLGLLNGLGLWAVVRRLDRPRLFESQIR